MTGHPLDDPSPEPQSGPDTPLARRDSGSATTTSRGARNRVVRVGRPCRRCGGDVVVSRFGPLPVFCPACRSARRQITILRSYARRIESELARMEAEYLSSAEASLETAFRASRATMPDRGASAMGQVPRCAQDERTEQVRPTVHGAQSATSVADSPQ